MTKNTAKRCSSSALLAALVYVAVAGNVRAESTESAPPKGRCPLLSPQELSFRFSYGIANRDSLRFYTFGPRVAYDLPDAIPAIAGNRLRIALETTGSIIHGDHHDRDGEFAFSPLILDYRFDRGGFFVPFVNGGEGIVITTLDHLKIGGPLEFSTQAGGGFHLFFTEEQAITFDFRFRHISNAGIKDDNRGLNTFFFTVGLSRFPNRR